MYKYITLSSIPLAVGKYPHESKSDVSIVLISFLILFGLPLPLTFLPT
jgi:hypothetical protein